MTGDRLMLIGSSVQERRRQKKSPPPKPNVVQPKLGFLSLKREEGNTQAFAVTSILIEG
jgi:hypothetical protein